MKLIITLTMLAFFAINQAAAQCTPPLATPPILCGTGTLLVDGATVGTGQTHNFTGIGQTLSNIAIDGGSLVLCGTVTLNNTNFNSGTLLINPGATVTFSGNFNTGSNNNFYNFGNTTISSSINVSGTNTFVFNAAGAFITVNGFLTVFNSGLFINNGTASATDVTINSGAQICLGPGSTATTNLIVSNQTNAVTVPTGTACVSYATSFAGNNAISNTPNLHICQLAGAAAPVPVVMGSATLNNPCTNCATALPLTLTSFKGRQTAGGVELEWITTWEENVRSFIVEKSTNGSVWISAGEVAARNQPSTYRYATTAAGDTWFRLKMTDIDGRFSYSSVIRIKAHLTGIVLQVLSNPVAKNYADVSIQADKNQRAELLLLDNTGRIRKQRSLTITPGTHNIRFDLSGILPGQYYLHFKSASEQIKPIAFLKL